ncbi:MAG: phage holin family protein [Candidatus Eremiobacteraeota bacterium]|nr:phage holin family protein [Candidatus Eremiobacteraeota bacterium]
MESGDPDLRNESIGDLFKRLTSDMTLLMRQEFELFRVEMTEKGKRVGERAGMGAGMLSAAAVCGLFALATLTATVILLLSLVMPAWVAALIVTVAYGGVAGVLAIAGKRKLDTVRAPVPTQTIETVKEDIEWAKTRTSSARR